MRTTHLISLGAGVQSSTVALLAAHGEITPMPELAIFADTQWEPKAVYAWLDWLEQQLPFPVMRVTAGDIRQDQLSASVRRRAALPYFTREPSGKIGMVKRQCTQDYKIRVLEQQFKRAFWKLAPKQRVPGDHHAIVWYGISSDEAQRMKPSPHKWMTKRYPLAMELGMSRSDCLAWMRRKGYPQPPRSACIGCPYHSDQEWRAMRDERPEEWADAIEFDKAIRSHGGMRGDTFLHRSCVPLDQVTFLKDKQPDLWGEECEGGCGL